MGAFNGVFGEMHIPEDERQIWGDGMLKLMQAGGMVQVESVKIFGTEIHMLTDLAYDDDGYCTFYYNYIMDDSWESVIIDKRKGYYASGKVGEQQFSNVIFAGYLLCELYSDTYCLAHENSELTDASSALGWINQVLGSQYGNQRYPNLWKIFELFQKTNDWNHIYSDKINNLDDFFNYVQPLAQYSLDQILIVLYVLHGAKAFVEHEHEALDKLSATSCLNLLIYTLKYWLKKFQAEEGQESEALQLLVFKQEAKQVLCNQNLTGVSALQALTYMVELVNPVVYVKAVAEVYGKKFWQLWWQQRDKIKNLGVLDINIDETNSMVANTKSTDFLDYPGFIYVLAHRNNPDTDTERHLTADDFLYYWHEGGEFTFSEELQNWFSDLQQRMVKLERNAQEIYPGQYMCQVMVKLLDKADKQYKRIYAFATMFYEFVEHGSDWRYRAAMKILEEIMENNAGIGEQYQPYFVYNWELNHPNVILNPGRREIKRYLALLANIELRRKVLGF